MAIVTPFSQQYEQIQTRRMSGEQNILQGLPQQTAQPSVGDSMFMQVDTERNDPTAMRVAASKQMVQDRMTGSREQLTKFATQLQQRVATGQMSPSEASAAMDGMVNDIVESHHVGFTEAHNRDRARDIGVAYDLPEDQVFNMLQEGFDPEMIGRATSTSTTVGILDNAMRSQGVPAQQQTNM